MCSFPGPRAAAKQTNALLGHSSPRGMKWNKTKRNYGKGTNRNEKREEKRNKMKCVYWLKWLTTKASKLDIKFLDWFGRILSCFEFHFISFSLLLSFTLLPLLDWDQAHEVLLSTIQLFFSYTIMKKLHSFLVEAVSPRNGLHWKWVNSPKQFIFIVHGQVFAFFSLIINLSIVLEVVIGHKTTLTVFLRACE